MKINKLISGVLGLALGMTGCDSMSDNYQQYLDRGETIYIGKADSLKVFPGRERLKLTWQLNADPKLKECLIYWNDKQDSVVVPIERTTTGRFTMEKILAPMKEQGYVFQVRTRDMYGNVSLMTEKSGTCYGENYESSLLPRAIIAQEAIEEQVVISWGNVDELVGVELKYKDRQGEDKTLLIKPEETETVIADYVPGGDFTYTTLYLPEECIDTLYSSVVKTNFARPLVNKEQDLWTLVQETSHGEYSDGSIRFGGGELAFDGDETSGWHSGWNGESLPQWITIDLGEVCQEVQGVEIVRPHGSWLTDTKEMVIYGCETECERPAEELTGDPGQNGHFRILGVVTFSGSEKSKVVKFSAPANIRYLACKGTKAAEGKSAVQIMEVYLKVFK